MAFTLKGWCIFCWLGPARLVSPRGSSALCPPCATRCRDCGPELTYPWTFSSMRCQILQREEGDNRGNHNDRAYQAGRAILVAECGSFDALIGEGCASLAANPTPRLLPGGDG